MMKSFATAIFLLFSQAASAEFGLDTRGMQRRNLDSVDSMSMLVSAKSFKTKSKTGKTKKPFSADVDASMSYTLAKSFKSADSDDSSPASSTDASPTQKSKGAALKHKGSAKSKEGNSDDTSAAKQKGSAKSKDSSVAKQKGSASSKESAKGADLTYKSAKGADLSKYVRSSLKPIETSGRVPDTASAMGAENAASVLEFKAAFIVSACVVVGAALSAV